MPAGTLATNRKDSAYAGHRVAGTPHWHVHPHDSANVTIQDKRDKDKK
jgi:hypothetical protein